LETERLRYRERKKGEKEQESKCVKKYTHTTIFAFFPSLLFFLRDQKKKKKKSKEEQNKLISFFSFAFLLVFKEKKRDGKA
jgi:uncharacterized membrane protein YadS